MANLALPQTEANVPHGNDTFGSTLMCHRTTHFIVLEDQRRIGQRYDSMISPLYLQYKPHPSFTPSFATLTICASLLLYPCHCHPLVFHQPLSPISPPLSFSSSRSYFSTPTHILFISWPLPHFFSDASRSTSFLLHRQIDCEAASPLSFHCRC